ncbi:MAG: DNA alkylation repair protein [Candidatus Aminicenantaceae bacterium]
MILPAKKREFLADGFAISDLLLHDEDDMVQKGYGWLFKEISNRFPDEVFQYVMKHKITMPRTALRYAIEKMPAEPNLCQSSDQCKTGHQGKGIHHNRNFGP